MSLWIRGGTGFRGLILLTSPGRIDVSDISVSRIEQGTDKDPVSILVPEARSAPSIVGINRMVGPIVVDPRGL